MHNCIDRKSVATCFGLCTELYLLSHCCINTTRCCKRCTYGFCSLFFKMLSVRFSDLILL